MGRSKARYTNLPWRTGLIPLDVPDGEVVLVRGTRGVIELGIMHSAFLYVGGCAHRRDLDPRIHVWVEAWCLLSAVDAALQEG